MNRRLPIPAGPAIGAVALLVALVFYAGWIAAAIGAFIGLQMWAAGVLHERYHSEFSLLSDQRRRHLTLMDRRHS